MKLVEILTVSRGGPRLDAHLDFQLSAGVDVVLALTEDEGVRRQLERREGVHVVADPGGGEDEKRTKLAALAATEHGADWLINSEATEFWWPRGEGLKDVLAPIPPRYTVVQALRRTFIPDGDAGDDDFSERLTLRPSFRDAAPDRGPAELLLPVVRADQDVVVRADKSVSLRRFVPLRAWYPIEVFDFGAREPRRPDDELVPDTRLRDALRTLEADGALPSFRTPDIVDDAAYAVECAAVGEVDLPRLEQYITELEQRIGVLEQRFWPRLARGLARVARRVDR